MRGDRGQPWLRKPADADADTTGIITVATESAAPLEVLFPAEGDAPGGDFDGVLRPPDSRRTFAATFDGEAYGVRMYELGRTISETVATPDEEMRKHGWSSSTAVAKSLPDARLYTRGNMEMVASFRSNPDRLTSVTIAPLSTP
ncbi:hypothetical protein LVJ94_04070 [Pendulispora rubella]|uniref:Uncharacterized protein n=1 Tax=Pendulispora rubella TaxID=2741070 RepID=A0ABZ2L6N0_9BACT